MEPYRSLLEVERSDLVSKLTGNAHRVRRGTNDAVLVNERLHVGQVCCEDAFEDLETEFER